VTEILISSAFGLVSFGLISAVCVWVLKPEETNRETILDFSAAPVPVPAAPLKTDEPGQFLPITFTADIKLPRSVSPAAETASLPLTGPVRQRFRPFSIQERAKPTLVMNQVQNISGRP
jgi:hypothetical protein